MNVKPEFLSPGLFRDRREAGRLLAAKLTAYANRPDVIVLALPRGGVPVGYAGGGLWALWGCVCGGYEVARARRTPGRLCRAQAWRSRLRRAGDGRRRDRRRA